MRWTVVVTDGAVSVSAAVTINITNNANETPPAPAAPTVTPTSGSTTSLDVSWTAPANTGRPTITGYDLQYRVDGESSWTDGPQGVSGTSASIVGLVAGTSYEVQVRAVNTDGAGAWSGASDGDTTPPTPTVRFGASAYTAIESLAGTVVTVLLDPAATRAVTILVTTTPQDGASSADYDGVPQSVTFAAGETEQSFTVTATDDTVADDGESLQLGFERPALRRAARQPGDGDGGAGGGRGCVDLVPVLRGVLLHRYRGRYGGAGDRRAEQPLEAGTERAALDRNLYARAPGRGGRGGLLRRARAGDLPAGPDAGVVHRDRHQR